MAGALEKAVEFTITNRMGFHVRPVQRFAQMAGAFVCEVEVEVNGRRVPGKSIINLMSLGAKCGDRARIIARGEDAEQCVGVLKFLGESNFFVEDNIDVSDQPNRHIERLVAIAGCFLSDVRVTMRGKAADAKDVKALAKLRMKPCSEPTLKIRGPDAAQARALLANLTEQCFYVEDDLIEKSQGVQ